MSKSKLSEKAQLLSNELKCHIRDYEENPSSLNLAHVLNSVTNLIKEHQIEEDVLRNLYKICVTD